MSTARYLVGDVRKVLASLPSASVDLVVTSPPYLSLRSYLPASHPDKSLEIGSEATPGEFIDTMLDVVEAIAPVLAPHGTICVELGDTMAGSGGAGGDYNAGGLRDGQERFSQKANKYGDRGRAERGPGPNGGGAYDTFKGGGPGGPGWPLERSMTLIPELFRFAVVYGFNPLTGRQTPRWRLRNVVHHFRPNPPVGSLGDKWRAATSDWAVLCKDRRYFDLDAVRTPGTEPGAVKHKLKNHSAANPRSGWDTDNEWIHQNPAGAPPLDWCVEDDLEWVDGAGIVLPTEPYKGSHYAVFSKRLVARLLDCQCPRRVCLECGQPSMRLTGLSASYRSYLDSKTGRHLEPVGERKNRIEGDRRDAEHVTLGWSCCGHGDGCQPTRWETTLIEVDQGRTPDGRWLDLDDWDSNEPPAATRTKQKRKRMVADVGDCRDNHWRPGLVLDPFAGTGTVLAVASGHGRDSIGIDLDEANAQLALDRVGPLFLTVEDQGARATSA